MSTTQFMGWYDGDKKTTLAAKIARAADHYRRKYGALPTVCFVHPKMLSAGQSGPAYIALEASKTVPPGHFWLGVEDGSANAHQAVIA